MVASPTNQEDGTVIDSLFPEPVHVMRVSTIVEQAKMELALNLMKP